MKHRKIAALVVLLALAITPPAWARGTTSRSGFSSARPSVNVSSVSSSGRASGFGSAATSKSTAAATASTGLGNALYSATAGKAAANTYVSNKAQTNSITQNAAASNYGSVSNAVPAGVALSGGNGSGGQYAGTSQTHTVEVHHYHDSSSDGTANFFAGWMMGQASHRDYVVVQPAPVVYGPLPAAQDAPQPATLASDGRNAAAMAGIVANSQNPAADTNHTFAHLIAWMLGLSAGCYFGYRLWSAWSARKASYTATNHYKL